MNSVGELFSAGVVRVNDKESSCVPVEIVCIAPKAVIVNMLFCFRDVDKLHFINTLSGYFERILAD